MKILRSVTRRGFNVSTAGWFTVLRPNTWFPASRLPEKRRHFAVQAKGAESAQESGRPAETPPTLRILELNTRDRQLTRPALVVLAALAVAWVLLWLIIRAP